MRIPRIAIFITLFCMMCGSASAWLLDDVNVSLSMDGDSTGLVGDTVIDRIDYKNGTLQYNTERDEILNQTGIVGTAIRTDMDNDIESYVTLDHSGEWGPKENLTAMGWYYMRNDGYNSGFFMAFDFVGSGDAGSRSGWYFYHQVPASNMWVDMIFLDTNRLYSPATCDPGDDGWVHVAFIRNSTNISVYLNATKCDSFTVSSANIDYDCPNSDDTVYIGSWHHDGLSGDAGDRVSNMTIDEVHILDYAITPAELNTVYTSELGGVGYGGAGANNAPTVDSIEVEGDAWNQSNTTYEGLYATSDSDAESVYNYTWFNSSGKQLVLYQPFDIQNTTETKGVSSYDTNGTIYSDPLYVPGKYGTALWSGGESTHFTNLSNPSHLDMNNTDFSVMAWVKVNESDGSQHIYSARGDAADKDLRFFFGGGGLRLELDWEKGNLGEQNCRIDGDLQNDTWYHVAATFDLETLNCTIYIDGAKEHSVILTYAPDTKNKDKIISDGSFNGSVDEVRLYNYRLTPELITNIYNGHDNLSTTETTKNERWMYNVRASDDEDYSDISSLDFDIANAVPVLELFDVEGDAENSTNTDYYIELQVSDSDNEDVYNYSWFKNDTHGQVLYLPFDFDSGTTAYDVSDWEDHGTINGVISETRIWYGPGVYGQAIVEHTRTADYIALGSPSHLDLNNTDFTIMTWLKLNESGAAHQYIYQADTDANDKDIRFRIDQGNMAFRVDWEANNSGEQYITSIGELTEDVWTHVAFTFNREKLTARLYINGVENREKNMTYAPDTKNQQKYVLGGEINGTIDEFRIFDYRLSEEMIKAIYEGDTNLSDNITAKNQTWSAYVRLADDEINTSITSITQFTTAENVLPNVAPPIYVSSGGDNTFFLQSLTAIYADASDSEGDTLVATVKVDSEVGRELTASMSYNGSDFSYIGDVVLDSVGTWTITVEVNDTDDTVTNTTQFTVTSESASTMYDGFSAYDTGDVLTESDYDALSEYGYDMYGNWLTYNSSFENDLKGLLPIINYTLENYYTPNFLVLNMTHGSYDNATATTDCVNLTANLSAFKTYPYLDATSFIVLVTENVGGDNDRAYYVNRVAACVRSATANQFNVYSYQYNSTYLDTSLVERWTMPRISDTTEAQWITAERDYLKNSTTLTRIYSGLSDAVKHDAEEYWNATMNNIRSVPEPNVSVNAYTAQMENKDVIVFNTGGSRSNLSVDVLNAYGKDAWDYTNKELFPNISSSINIEVDGYRATAVYLDNVVSILIGDDNVSRLLKAAVAGSGDSFTYGNNGTADSSFPVVGANDARAELWDADYVYTNLEMHTYEDLDYSYVTDFTPYQMIVITRSDSANSPATVNASLRADQNPGILDRTYGYISVADYNNTDPLGNDDTPCDQVIKWENNTIDKADLWIDNYSLNVFIDGFDIGFASTPTCFEERIKRIADHIRFNKNKSTIFNTYTIYQSIANYGDYVMRESCFSRWDGLVTSPVYSYESWALMEENAEYLSSVDKPVVCMAFGAVEDYDKMAYDFHAFAVLYGADGDNLFRYAQPDFQTQREIKVPNIGTMLQSGYTKNSANDYSRKYANGIVHVDPTRTVPFENGKYYYFDNGETIKEMNFSVIVQQYSDGCDSGKDIVFQVNGDNQQRITTEEVGCGIWSTTNVTKSVSTDAYEYHGHYYLTFRAADRGQATGMNIFSRSNTERGVHSWWDNTAFNPPTESQWTAYARSGAGDQYSVNFKTYMVVDRSTQTAIDNDIMTIYQEDEQFGASVLNRNLTVSSDKHYNITVVTDPVYIKQTNYWGVFMNDTNLTVLNTTDCLENKPTFAYTDVNALTVGACLIENSSGITYRFSFEHLSDKEIIIYGKDPNLAPTVNWTGMEPSPTAYSDQDIGIYCIGDDYDHDNITYEYRVYLNDALQANGNYSGGTAIEPGNNQSLYNLSSASTSIGDIVNGSCRLNDGTNESAWVDTDNITIVNEPPYLSDVNITPVGPNVQSNVTLELWCRVQDDDNDAIDIAYAFYEKVPAGAFAVVVSSIGTTGQIHSSGDLVNVVNISFNQTTKAYQYYGVCSVDDGVSGFVNETASQTITVINTPPILNNVSTVPEGNVSADVDIYAYVNYTEYDFGDDITTFYTWYKDGVENYSNYDQDVVAQVANVQWSATYPATNMVDRDWDTYAERSAGVGDAYFHINYTIPDGYEGENFYVFAKESSSTADYNYTRYFAGTSNCTDNGDGILTLRVQLTTGANTVYYLCFDTPSTTVTLKQDTLADILVYEIMPVWEPRNISNNDENALISTLNQSNTSIGDVWTFEAWGIDYEGFPSEHVNATEITIRNNPPVMNDVYIMPVEVTVNDTLEGFCNASDLDNNTLGFNWKWYVNGTENETGSTAVTYAPGEAYNVANLTPTDFGSGDDIIFSCQATDTYNTSAWVNSSTVSIGNALPVADAELGPLNPSSSETLYGSCNGTDADGEALRYDYKWYRNTALYASGTTETDETQTSANASSTSGPVLNSANCNDGDFGTACSSSGASPAFFVADFYKPDNAVRANTELHLKFVVDDANYTIPEDCWNRSPIKIRTEFNTGATGLAVTCEDSPGVYGTTIDQDISLSDRNFYDIEVYWNYEDYYTQGIEENISTIDSSLTSAGEFWQFSCRAYDGTNVSAYDNSSIMQIQNAPPAITGYVTPEYPEDDDQLHCNFNITDADGVQSVNATITWYNSSDNVTYEQVSTYDYTYLDVTKDTLITTTAGTGSVTGSLNNRSYWKCGLFATDGYNATRYNTSEVSLFPLSITLISPDNGTYSNQLLNVSFNASDDDGGIECALVLSTAGLDSLLLFQEDVNSTSTDGDYVNFSLIIDGNYSTASSVNPFTTAQGYFNYSKPSYDLHSAAWQVKDNVGKRNMTLPDSCVNNSKDHIYMRATIRSYGGGLIRYYCTEAGGSEVLLYENLGSGNPSSLYEEAVIWNVSIDELTTSYVSVVSDDISYINYSLTQDALYEWQVECNSIGSNASRTETREYTYDTTENTFSNYSTDESALYPEIGDVFSMNVTVRDILAGVDTCKLMMNDTGSFVNVSTYAVNTSDAIVEMSYTIQNYSRTANKSIQWRVWCNDTAGNYNKSAIQNVTVKDDTAPSITLNALNGFDDTNTSVISKHLDNLSIDITFTDYNLFQAYVNVTCDISGVIYDFEQLNFNLTEYDLQETVDLSGLPLQRCVFDAGASDDHTEFEIEEYETDRINKGMRYETTEGINVQIIADDDGFRKVNTDKKIDRYNFNFQFKDKALYRDFRIVSDHKLYYRGDSKYPGHFVAWNPKTKSGNWIDFEELEGDVRKYDVTRVSDNEYRVRIYAGVPVDMVDYMPKSMKEPKAAVHKVTPIDSPNPTKEVEFISSEIPSLQGVSGSVDNDVEYIAHAEESDYYGLENITFNSIGGTNVLNVSYEFYIGAAVNVSSFNVYDNTSFENMTVEVVSIDSEFPVDETVSIVNSSQGYIQNITNGTYTFTISNDRFFTKTYTVNVSSGLVNQTYSTFQAAVYVYFRNIKTKDHLNNSEFNITNLNTSQQAFKTRVASTPYKLYLDANDYEFNGSAVGYSNLTQMVDFNYRTNTTVYMDLPFVAIFNLYDERTQGIFNLNGTNRTSFLLFCGNSTYTYEVNTTSFEIPIICEYKKFKFNLEYGEAAYYRTFILEPDEALNTSIYLIDLLTTNAVYTTFSVDDLLNDYRNVSVIITKNIGDETVQITGDFADIENKIGAYLIENHEYFVEVHSVNKPTRTIGAYNADVTGNKVIRLYDIVSYPQENAGMLDGVEWNSYVNDTDNETMVFVFNDTTEASESVTFYIYNELNSSVPLFSYTINDPTVVEMTVNISAYENMSLYAVTRVSHPQRDVSDMKIIRQINDINFALKNVIGETMLNWIIVVILGVLLLMSTISTAALTGVGVAALALVLNIFGMFTLSTGLIIFALFIGILALVIEGWNRK